MHPNNIHKAGYDFEQLIQRLPKMAEFVFINEYGKQTIDFAKPEAVKMLNKSLLLAYYGLETWDIPKGYLCPPIPGRADYIHHIADFLTEKKLALNVKILDIGVGANGVYPIIGIATYGWKFVGSDVDAKALEALQTTIDRNPRLQNNIELRKQTSLQQIFAGIVQPEEVFDICICNPPFHASAEESEKGTTRKWNNLGRNTNNKRMLNFGGQSNELWCEGGELGFLRMMVQESKLFHNQFRWFSSLVSKYDNLSPLFRLLKSMNAKDIQAVEMEQGQKKSRILIWRF